MTQVLVGASLAGACLFAAAAVRESWQRLAAWVAAAAIALFVVVPALQHEAPRVQVAQAGPAPTVEAIPDPPAAERVRSSAPSLEALQAEYGSTRLPLETMPADAKAYLAAISYEIGYAYDVRPGDIVARLNTETKGNGVYFESDCSRNSAGVRGVGQISDGFMDAHGVDWNENGTANPCEFEDALATIANHMAKEGVTVTRLRDDPDGFMRRLRDNISRYNSGRPYAVAAAFRQSATSDWTVATYVANAIDDAAWWETSVTRPYADWLRGQAAAAATRPPDATPTAEPVDIGGGPIDRNRQIKRTFDASPLNPMPRIAKGFGVPVTYQSVGYHTGADFGLPRGADGKEPPLYAVCDATVVWVGPMYYDTPGSGRGDDTITLDCGPVVDASGTETGERLLVAYGHNSAAVVTTGDQVLAGQMIGRQGNEGFSYGSHVHFEVCPCQWTGNWRAPFDGKFVDPAPFLKPYM